MKQKQIFNTVDDDTSEVGEDESEQEVKMEFERVNEHRWQAIKTKTARLDGQASVALRNLQAYTQKIAQTDVSEIEPLIASMIADKDNDIGPLLRLYDELAENTKFKLPSREMLKLD